VERKTFNPKQKKEGIMKTTMNTMVAVLGLVLGMASLSRSVQASDWNLALGFGNARGTSVHTERRWVPERYETRNEVVLVEAAHMDRVFVEPVYETRTDYYGKVFNILIQPGFWKEIQCPAKYETVATQVVVPGYWEDVQCNDHRGDFADNRGWNDRNHDFGGFFGYSDRDSNGRGSRARDSNGRGSRDRDSNGRGNHDREISKGRPEVRKQPEVSRQPVPEVRGRQPQPEVRKPEYRGEVKAASSVATKR